ncbi:hypothetical protein Ccrd_002867 [Cynara cardunculus var. scolymus]|uniref:Uncharacterized protein n=1 Tax=Cynara cardunculus var. scolymus TaxID=59895 RepID=A0A103XQK8_CYNCS|nr:hypothetical protein Ccrd_002867 [Cynara cardunculus var. scolymus]
MAKSGDVLVAYRPYSLSPAGNKIYCLVCEIPSRDEEKTESEPWRFHPKHRVKRKEDEEATNHHQLLILSFHNFHPANVKVFYLSLYTHSAIFIVNSSA